MKETDLRGRKACVVPVAVAAGLSMAGMGLVSNGVVMADTTSVTDTINVTVQPSCTFNGVDDETYAGSAMNGTEVNNFNDSGVHEFNLFCNDNNGFIVTATAYDLAATGIQDVIAYTDNYTHTGINSMWTAAITTNTPGVVVVNQVVPEGGGTIISSDSHTVTAGANFTATYSAYAGTETPAGTYTGTIVYTLVAAGTSNNSGNGGNSGSNDNGGSGANSGNEVTDNSGSGEGEPSSGTDSGSEVTDNSGSGTDEPNSGTNNANSGDSSNAPSNTQSVAPLALNNSYPTYTTTSNTYNANYSGGSGASVPATTGMQAATSGDNSGTTSGDSSDTNDNGGDTGDSYEQPLGVVTSTSSSNKDSGMDMAPLAVTGTVLAVAGVAAVAAMAQNEKKEEEE